jgi:hypothetical protein
MPPHLYLHAPMNMKFAPPNIEKGPWFIGTPSTYATYNANKVNAEKVGICEVYGIPLHSSLEEVEKDKRSAKGLAHARLLAAAPSMAEALAKFVEVCDSAPPVELLRMLGECRAVAGDALLSAGYTLATDPE